MPVLEAEVQLTYFFLKFFIAFTQTYDMVGATMGGSEGSEVEGEQQVDEEVKGEWQIFAWEMSFPMAMG